ncbi:MAG: Ig-like domain-containing protein, partial [Pseudomonadota bacterium]
MAGEATLQITLNKGIQSSNFSRDSFVVVNTGTKTIAEIVIDVSGALFPDMVFDPFGEAGDTTTKALTIDTNGGTGVVTPSAASYIGAGGIDGFTGIVLTFDPSTNNGFEPGETLGFSVDMDPNSIAGAQKDTLDNGSSPSWDVGGVNGAELIGSTFTVTFSDGTTASGQLQGVLDSPTTEEQGGAQALASQGITESSVTLTVNGLAAGDAGTYTPGNVTVTVEGVAGETARITLAKGFIQPGDNLFEQPYKSQLDAQLSALAASDFPANNAVEFQVVDVLLTGSPQDVTSLFNFTSVPISEVDNPDTLPLGFVASVIDPSRDGLATGPATTPIYLKSENRAPTPVDDTGGTTGDPVVIDVLANDSDPDGDVLALASFTQGTGGTVTRD